MRHNGTTLDSLGNVFRTLNALTWATRSARTRGGQIGDLTRWGMEKQQVSGYSDGSGSAGCKTVGLAYVGSNPTPATTCGNGLWPGHTRARGPSSSCPAVSHDVPL